MKKNYTVSLDVEKVDKIKGWIAKRGISFSAYLNSLLHEQLSVLRKKQKELKSLEGVIQKHGWRKVPDKHLK